MSALIQLIVIAFHIFTVQTLTISGYGIKDLEGTDSVSFQKEADWWNLTRGASSVKITQTTSTLKWLLGGPDILYHVTFDSQPKPCFERTYTNLPPHSFVGISIEFWYFDNTQGIGNFTGFFFQVSSLGNRIIGPQLRLERDFTTEDGGNPSQYDLRRDRTKFAFLSSLSELNLVIQVTDSAGVNIQSFGFRELHIHFSNYSGIVPALCHISEDINPFAFEQCNCSVHQAHDSSNNCVNCATNCDVCFGPAASECLACSAGAYWDGNQCNTCHLMCQTCSGVTSHDCPSCKYGFYNYGNNTCMESCELPFVAEQIGIDLFCKPKCTNSQFYLALNSSCLNKCDFPLIHAPDENGIEYCLNPCEGTAKYLYANGSCLDGCKTPLVPRFESYIRFCINPCLLTTYLFTNGSCFLSCPFPLLSRSEPGTQFCWNPCFSGNFFLFNNGSCEKTCPAPLVSRFELGVRYCGTPCGSVNDYIYDNKSCDNSCTAPLMSRIEPLVARYCLNPCLMNSNSFLYPNGSCLTSCRFPLLGRTEPNVKYCYSPCSDYIYSDGTCKNFCPFPLMTRVEPDFKYCFTPCQPDEYLYSDQSCHDSCNSPLLRRLEPGVKYCDTPCSESEYVYQDGSCNSKCEYPYKVLKNPSYKVCSMNLDEIQTSQAHSLARGTDIANTVCGIGGLLTGFISPGDSTSMLMWSLLKMLQFTKYIDVNFPGQMLIIFTQQNDNYNGDGYMSSIGNGRRILNSQGEDLGRFSYYGIPVTFLENYWQQLIVFAVLFLLLGVSVLLLRFMTNPKYLKALKYLRSALEWNIILMFFCGSYGDLVLYSALEFQTASFNNFGSIMSFIVCLLMVILAVYIPLKVLYVIRTIRKAKLNQPGFGEKDAGKQWSHNRVFFEAYKSDGFIQHVFLVIYLVRVAFFNVIIGYIFNSPLAQALLINFLSFGMLAYILLKVPIKDHFCFYQQILTESMLFVYNLCLLILVIMDRAEAKAESTRAFFGGTMVVILIVGPVACAVLIALKLILRIRELYDKTQAQKESEKSIFYSFRFRKVRARGNFLVGNNDTINMNLDTINNSLSVVKAADESNLEVIAPPHPHQNQRNYSLPSKGILKNKLNNREESSINMNLEKNLENLIVQIYAKKGQNNRKRRKVNTFQNDEYLPE